MAHFRGPQIERDGLVCCIDPHNKQSFDSNVSTNLFYDISGIKSSSGNQLVGTLVAGASYETSGLASGNSTFTFDGTDDYGYIGVMPEGFQPTEGDFSPVGYTVIQWVLPTDATIGTQRGLFNNGSTGATTYYGMNCFINSSGYWGMMIGDGGGSGPSNRRTCLSNQKAALSKWSHVAFRFGDGTPGKFQIHVNGELSSMQTETGSGGDVAYSATAGIGVNQTNYFKGNLGPTWVYLEDLDLSKIQRHYEVTKEKYNNPA